MSSGIISAQPEKILKALGQVWTSLGEEERHQGKPTVLRACAMTLIVVSDEEDEESGSVSQILVELMHAHPSRAIVLRSDRQAENGLSARVFAQCWKPFGKAQQICCEQIEVAAHPDRWPDVGPTVLGIVVPDLPVVVWCRMKSALTSARSGRQTGLGPVLGLATKIVVDTRATDLKDAFAVLREWKSAGHMIGDLEWTRITPWRETIATVFDENPRLLKPSSFGSVEIGYSGNEVPASALYLAAWLQQGVTAKFTFHAEDGLERGLTRVTLAGEETVDLSRTSPTCLKLRVGDQEQRVSLAGSSFYELMHEELTVLGQDPVFNAAFDRTAESYH